MGIKIDDVALQEFYEGLKKAQQALQTAKQAMKKVSAANENWHDFQKKDFDEIVRNLDLQMGISLEDLSTVGKRTTKMLALLQKYNRHRL